MNEELEMTKTEALAKIEELQKYVDSIPEEPQTEPRHGRSYRYLYCQTGVWKTDTEQRKSRRARFISISALLALALLGFYFGGGWYL